MAPSVDTLGHPPRLRGWPAAPVRPVLCAPIHHRVRLPVGRCRAGARQARPAVASPLHTGVSPSAGPSGPVGGDAACGRQEGPAGEAGVGGARCRRVRACDRAPGGARRPTPVNKESGSEAELPAQQSTAQAQARFPGPDADQVRPCGHQPASGERPAQRVGVSACRVSAPGQPVSPGSLVALVGGVPARRRARMRPRSMVLGAVRGGVRASAGGTRAAYGDRQRRRGPWCATAPG